MFKTLLCVYFVIHKIFARKQFLLPEIVLLENRVSMELVESSTVLHSTRSTLD
jgi:hypothetical protein